MFWHVKGVVVAKSKTSLVVAAQYPEKQQQTGIGAQGHAGKKA